MIRECKCFVFVLQGHDSYFVNTIGMLENNGRVKFVKKDTNKIDYKNSLIKFTKF